MNRKKILSLGLTLLFVGALAPCPATARHRGITPGVTEVHVQRSSSGEGRQLSWREASPGDVVLRPGISPTSFPGDPSIIGTALASREQCVKYLLKNNPRPNISVSPEELVAYYYAEGEKEGIRPDVAFAQAIKETGFFRYGGTVTADQNNYCGLGTTDAAVKGAYFPSSLMGVRAHIQHLLAYASTRRPQEPLVDPRYRLVRERYGNRTLDRWDDLNGRWAVPGYGYGQSIMGLYLDILRE